MTLRIFVTGDSHTAQLKLGADLLAERGEMPPGLQLTVRALGNGRHLPTPFFRDAGDHLEIVNNEYRRQVERLPPEGDDAGCDWIGVCGPFHSSRVFRSPDWKRFELAGEHGGRVALTPALMRRVISDDQRYVMGMITALKRMGQRVFALESPRPFRHHRMVRVFGAERVARIDRLYRGFMREWLGREGIPVLDAPRETYDDAGFSLDGYRIGGKDQHHANAEFGALQVRAIPALLGTAARAQAG